MFICDCHCDTLTELYNKNASLYENEQHFDIKRQIALGGGLLHAPGGVAEQAQQQRQCVPVDIRYVFNPRRYKKAGDQGQENGDA